jgi:hypothetical protein
MQMLGCEASRMKQAAGWLAEKAGRFKLNDALLSYTSLARLLESEALLMSATARQAFWQTVTHRPDLFPFEESALSDLNRQTMRHLAQLRRFHEQTAGMLEI